MQLTQTLRDEYLKRYLACAVRPERKAEAEASITRMMKSRARYEAVGVPLGVPWFLIALLHTMERDGDFGCHLHNGDPLGARTVHEPKGRPAKGTPPFLWESSATDALLYERLDQWHDWSVAGVLYCLEGFNGYGYHQASINIPSPYLWAGSQIYAKGKYVSDGHYDREAVSKQIGAAVLLERMDQQALVGFASAPAPAGVRP